MLTRLETRRCPTPSAWRSGSKTWKSRSQRLKPRLTHHLSPSADRRKDLSCHRTIAPSLAMNLRV